MSPEAGRVESAEQAAGGAGQPMGAGLDRMDRIRDILFGKEMQVYEKKLARLEERLVKEAAELREDVRKRFDSLETYTKKELEALVNQAKAEQQRREEALEELSQRIREATASWERSLAQLDEKNSASERELREQILGQVKQEQATRTQNVEELNGKLRETSAALERKLSELAEKAAATERELEAQITTGMKTEQDTRAQAVTELAQNLKEMGATLDRKFGQLEEKTIASERALREQILSQSKSLTDDLRGKYDEFRQTLEANVQELRGDKMDRSALAALLTEMSMRINKELDNLRLPGGR